MKRYKQANEGIHTPEEVKEKTARPAGKRSYARWAGVAAAVLAVVLIGGIAMGIGQTPPNEPDPLSGDGSGVSRSVPEDSPGSAPGHSQTAAEPNAAAAHALSAAVYPEMAPHPKEEDFFSDVGDGEDAWDKAYDAYNKAYDAWLESLDALNSNTDYTGLMDHYFTASAAQFLAGAGEENRVYSPLNVYMALSMLAETTGENSRAQLLELLEADSIETLRARADALWRDNYRDDGAVTSVLANSMWLRDGMTYSQETLDTLARQYYASAFSGEMGTEEYNQALRDWINQQTHGLLKEQAGGLKMNPETVLALASTIYFKAGWAGEFDKGRTGPDVFHAPSGDVDVDFMRKTLEDAYYWGSNFSAVQLYFQQGGSMWLVLPDEGCSADELLQSGEAMDFLRSDKVDTYDENGLVSSGWANRKRLDIHLSMPKFDVSSDLDLIDGLKALGVTDVFDSSVSNFDPLGASTDDRLYVSTAQHAARVKVDEEGCEAAAYTVIMVDAEAAPLPNEEIDFTLDRPFLFAITGESGLPLFLGVVNQPNG